MGFASALVTDTEHCYQCQSPYVDRHHCVPGIGRQASEKYKFVVPLCRFHHQGIHDGEEPELDMHLKQLSQRYYELHIGCRDEFIKEFGRSYL